MSQNEKEPQLPGRPGIYHRLADLVIGKPKSVKDSSIFHRLSLVAFFAWVGLGADGLSSSCYGPPEAFLNLGSHVYLGIFVALGTVITIFVVSASYSQIIELFPSGGGGYLVASKLLGPRVGMVSGCALLVDYVLTISTSIASGGAALFSMKFIPPELAAQKLDFIIAGVVCLTVMNLRGVKESVLPLVPIFLVFVLTHVIGIIYALVIHGGDIPSVALATAADMRSAGGELGTMGAVILVLRAFSMGAGTFTGIEAVSNGMPILREPRAHTAKKTMRYMAWSLSFMAMGLMLAYILFAKDIMPDIALVAHEKKTINALLFENLVSKAGWPGGWGQAFVLVTLVSEGAILFVAAQAGFVDGPRVISNMATDRWFPSRFAMLSERLVTQNGVLVMGAAAVATVILTHGSVKVLVILYSINVFITFSLSQLGMVRHWWQVRRTGGSHRWALIINLTGFVLCAGILITVTTLKFFEGGWVTLLITGSLIVVAVLIQRHYGYVKKLLSRLDDLTVKMQPAAEGDMPSSPPFDSASKTGVLLVSGFNGIGMHSLLNINRFFGDTFKNFIFVQIGVIDAGNFKGKEELDSLQEHTRGELDKYIRFCRSNGYFADSFDAMGVDVVENISELAPQILKKYPDAVFFGGQLVFPRDTFVSRWLHNAVVFAVQRRFYTRGIPFVILPIRVA
jgi:amino acid transporter